MRVGVQEIASSIIVLNNGRTNSGYVFVSKVADPDVVGVRPPMGDVASNLNEFIDKALASRPVLRRIFLSKKLLVGLINRARLRSVQTSDDLPDVRSVDLFPA